MLLPRFDGELVLDDAFLISASLMLLSSSPSSLSSELLLDELYSGGLRGSLRFTRVVRNSEVWGKPIILFVYSDALGLPNMIGASGLHASAITFSIPDFTLDHD